MWSESHQKTVCSNIFFTAFSHLSSANCWYFIRWYFFVTCSHSSHAVHTAQIWQFIVWFIFFALHIVAHWFLCIICSNALFLSPPARFFHLQTIIIKNNLHLLLFFIVCFSVSYSRLRTEFLFIHLLGDVFCIVVRSFCFIHIYGFVCTFAVGIVQKCHCFHASECVEMCSWCGVERSLANCANIIKSIL